ncbi:MAG: transporter [Verrucomicrobiota bacterium]
MRFSSRGAAFSFLILPFFGLAEAEADKSGYHLFNPTPRELMRELSTDRPDQTESPYTVDAGHFQIEMDVANGTIVRDQSNGGDVRSQVWGFGGMNLKAGLLNNVDIQFVLDGYVDSRVRDNVANVVADDSGFGDVQTRLKINLWGNDGGKTAFAIMPFLKWPLPQTALRNGKTEGGVILPLGVELPGGWGMGLMTEVDFVRDGSNAFDTEYFNTITFSHDIVGDLGGYVEFAALFTPESDAQWQGQLDVGFTYGLDENTQFDFGCNFDVTSVAPDYNPFIGLTVRF